jgi:hypothetical protein
MNDTPTRRGTGSPPPVLALLDGGELDASVVADAAALARVHRGAVLLVRAHAPVRRGVWRSAWSDQWLEPWQQRLGIETRLSRGLETWAAPLRAAGLAVSTEVCFGDALAEVVHLTRATSAGAIVLAARASAWVPWRALERRLARALPIPVHVVASAADTSSSAVPLSPAAGAA